MTTLERATPLERFLLLNATVDATGEYILGSIVTDAAQDRGGAGNVAGMTVEGLIGAFYSRYFALNNITSLRLQRFVVSRVAYNVLAFVPGLWVVLSAKVAEKGTDYSLSNTVRHMPFLPCTREEKYSAKQAIDSFFLRMGDVVSAGIVLVGTGFGFTATRFAQLNVVLAVLVGRAYAGRKAMPTVALRTPARQSLA